MTGFLLDTNVLSEAGKPSPDLQVRSFLMSLAEAWISAVTIHEIEFGIHLLPQGRKRADRESAMKDVIAALVARIIPLGIAEAQRAASLRAESRKRGRTLHLPDALIAATAKEHGLTLATRNISDFDHLGIDIIDPWAA